MRVQWLKVFLAKDIGGVHGLTDGYTERIQEAWSKEDRGGKIMNLESVEKKHGSKNGCVKYSINELAFEIKMRRE